MQLDVQSHERGGDAARARYWLKKVEIVARIEVLGLASAQLYESNLALDVRDKKREDAERVTG